MKTEIANWKTNVAKMRQTNSKLEADLLENKKIMEPFSLAIFFTGLGI